jgi:hypothetical protein
MPVIRYLFRTITKSEANAHLPPLPAPASQLRALPAGQSIPPGEESLNVSRLAYSAEAATKAEIGKVGRR